MPDGTAVTEEKLAKSGKMNVYVAVPLLGTQPGLPPAIFRGTCTAAWFTVAELETISTFALTWTVVK